MADMELTPPPCTSVSRDPHAGHIRCGWPLLVNGTPLILRDDVRVYFGAWSAVQHGWVRPHGGESGLKRGWASRPTPHKLKHSCGWPTKGMTRDRCRLTSDTAGGALVAAGASKGLVSEYTKAESHQPAGMTCEGFGGHLLKDIWPPRMDRWRSLCRCPRNLWWCGPEMAAPIPSSVLFYRRSASGHIRSRDTPGAPRPFVLLLFYWEVVTIRCAGRLICALLGAALVGAEVAALSGVAAAAVYSPQQALSAQAIQQFVADPIALLAEYPDGGGQLIARVAISRPPIRRR